MFAAFFVRASAFDDKSLLDVRKVEKLVEFGGGPDLALFDAAVVGRVAKDEIGLAAVFEVQTDVVEQSGLVVFDGEVVVGATLSLVMQKCTKKGNEKCTTSVAGSW